MVELGASLISNTHIPQLTGEQVSDRTAGLAHQVYIYIKAYPGAAYAETLTTYMYTHM